MGDLWVGRFSAGPPTVLSDGWQRLTLPRVRRHTRYELVSLDGRTVLKADADRSASAVTKKVTIDPRELPCLEWSWQVTAAVPGAGWEDKARDDFAARVFVFFDTPGGAGAFFRGLVTKVTRRLPGRALNYVWANGVDRGRMARSPYTDRVEMIAVESGDARAAAWVVERRNVIDDFTAAFGDLPGPIIGVALMTDTDNTHGRSIAYYGDIRFLSDPCEPGSAAWRPPGSAEATVSRLPMPTSVTSGEVGDTSQMRSARQPRREDRPLQGWVP